MKNPQNIIFNSKALFIQTWANHRLSMLNIFALSCPFMGAGVG